MERKKQRMLIKEINKTWTLDQALSQKGIFYLKPLTAILQVELYFLLGKMDDIKRMEGDGAQKKTGIFKEGESWVVSMETFSAWYQNEIHNQTVTRPHPDWNGNALLQKDGLFLLRDVCQLIPFTSGQLRYQVGKLADPKKEMGVWKCEQGRYAGNYLVFMPTFKKYISRIWNGVEKGGI